MEYHFLKDLLIVFSLGGLVVYAVRQIKVPAIAGLLITGAAIGPHGLSLVGDAGTVELLAEIGVVLLLFTIGLESSLARLLEMWRTLLFGGGGQLLLCITLVALCTWRQGQGLGQPLFFGFLAALSSTASVLRLLGERAQLGTPMGRIVLGVLLFQDLCIVPLMLLTPILAGQGSGAASVVWTLVRSLGLVVAVVVGARRILPPLLAGVVRTRSRELFLTFLLVLCLGTAYLTSLAGLSLALGAFLAGLAVSESEYSHQALAEAIPFRDAFGSLFFVSIGMLVDVGFLARHPFWVLGALLALWLIKTVSALLPVLLLGYPLHLALQVGLALAQIGEFAFVLSRSGLSLGLINPEQNQVFLAVSVASMLATPLLLELGSRLRRSLPDERLARGAAGVGEVPSEELRGHVVIAGYGVNGQNLAKELGSAKIPYAILEMNPETVRAARSRGEPIYYGDCTRAAVLESMGIAQARMFVIAISDAASTRQSTSLARSLSEQVNILVRTRFVAEVEELRRLGANEVIPEEFETSIEIFARVLQHFDVPKNLILDAVAHVRGGMYDMLRGASRPGTPLTGELSAFHGIEVERVQVREGSTAIGHTLLEIELRRTTGATVLAVQRGAEVHANPASDFRLELGDITLVVGLPAAIDQVVARLDPRVTVAGA
ncbi:MAG: cation:proton antiporter [Deltaproteobacteria bacterium]